MPPPILLVQRNIHLLKAAFSNIFYFSFLFMTYERNLYIKVFALKVNILLIRKLMSILVITGKVFLLMCVQKCETCKDNGSKQEPDTR